MVVTIEESTISDYRDIYRHIREDTESFAFAYRSAIFQGSLPFIDYCDERYYPTIKPLEFTSVSKENIKYLYDAQGIYVLNDCNGECLYVGQSTNLAVRLYQHINGMTNTSNISDMIEDIKVVLCCDGFLREVYETVTINELRPYENRDKVFYKRKE